MNSTENTALQSPWAPFEDRRRARDEKRAAVLRLAVKMFLEDGYHRTSLADVAMRLNITKPALYNYFRSKDDILSACYRAGFEIYETGMQAVMAADGSGLERLRGLIRAYAMAITTDFGRCVVRLDDRELLPEVRDQVRTTKRRFDKSFRDTIACGIADGSIKSCDVAMTSFVITGALNGIGGWFAPGGKKSSHVVAEHFADQLTQSLVPSQL
jgi:AcrR family transcriptional regulator